MKKIVILLVAIATFSAAQDDANKRRLPDRARCRGVVAARPWAKDLKQIPSTVIDKGVLRNVPYTSYRAGDYELNVYGDPAAPAGFEIGVYHDLVESAEAKKNCLDVIAALLNDAEDRKLLASLKHDVDKKVRARTTFEITPPTAEDAYGGWWVSIYDEAALDRSRADEKELAKITTTRQNVKRVDADKSDGPLSVDPVTEGRWGADDLRQARNRKDLAEDKQAVYMPVYSRKDGAYVPDRTIDDTGHIMFVCANSGKHEDREELIKSCPACKKNCTFFWETNKKCFMCFQCGAAYDNALIKCSSCGQIPRRVRTKHW